MSGSEKPIESKRGETAVEIASIALEAVPHVGGVLASTASYFLERRKNERLNGFLIDLAEDLQHLRNQINSDFVRSAHFQDLAENVFGKAAETIQQEKLDAFRAIFLNTVLTDHPDYNDAVEILDLVYHWQPRHIVLLKILFDPRSADEQMGKAVGEGGGLVTNINRILGKLLPGWDEEQIDRTWQDLYDARIHRLPGTRTMITDQGIRQLEGRLTDFGFKVASYLSNPVGE